MLLLAIDRQEPAARLPAGHRHGSLRLVDGGTLSPGDRLPPSRILARSAGIAPLDDVPCLRGAVGRSATSRAAAAPTRPSARRGAATWPRTPSRAAPLDWRRARPPRRRGGARDSSRLRPDPRGTNARDAIDFARLTADPSSRRRTPTCAAASCAALPRRARQSLDYGDPAGYPPLRETIARRHANPRRDGRAEEILITGGAQQALDLRAARCSPSPATRSRSSRPPTRMALPLFRLHGVTLRRVPLRRRRAWTSRPSHETLRAPASGAHLHHPQLPQPDRHHHQPGAS